jgi:Flp pilus assembly pilin Flp
MHRDRHQDAEHRNSEQGQTMTEYAVVLSIITILIMSTIVLLGDTAGNLMEKVASYL